MLGLSAAFGLLLLHRRRYSPGRGYADQPPLVQSLAGAMSLMDDVPVVLRLPLPFEWLTGHDRTFVVVHDED